MEDTDISVNGQDLPATPIQVPRPRNLFFTKQVDQASIADLTKQIIEINASDRLLEKFYKINDLEYKPKPINIYIDSYGGYVYQCFGLLGVMEKSITPIKTIVTGTAMSCGFMIAIFGHQREAYSYATLMYHQISGGAWGKLADMEDDVEEAKRLQRMIEDMTIRKTKMPGSLLNELFKMKKDYFMDVHTALKYGCIDKILD